MRLKSLNTSYLIYFPEKNNEKRVIKHLPGDSV